MVRTASHTDLRKRNAAFQAKAGRTNPLKKVDKLDTKKNTVPRWLFFGLMILLAGGLVLELGQLVLDQIWPPVNKYRVPR